MSSLDFTVMAIYFAIVLGIGAHFARRTADAGGYFLGRHDIPWWAVMLSIVATETSALTVLSMPGISARGDFTWIQITIGYLVGRVAVSIWLLPGYFSGQQQTAYSRLETRFGRPTRQLASGVFMVIRSMGDSVRVFATAIPLSLLTGWSPLVSVLIVAGVTLVYTLAGGIRAVIWVDVMQLAIYTLGGIITIVVAARLVGGIGNVIVPALDAGKLRAFDFQLSFGAPYTFAAGLIGGAMLSAASHGTDHLIVQRILTTADLASARKALVGSGVLVIGQIALFLFVGTALWAAGADDGQMASDQIYPLFMIDSLPAGLSGLVVAGLLAAAMSTVSSSLNSLASSTTHDFYAGLTGQQDERKLLRFGRWATVGWAVVLAGGALSFQSDQPVVELALSIASVTYGSLLGVFIMTGWSDRVRQTDAMVAIVVGTVSMLLIVLPSSGPLATLAWPWYVPLGTLITLSAGALSSATRRLVS